MASNWDLTPLTLEQRHQEVAAILGKGVLRLHIRAALTCNQPEHSIPEEARENSPGLP
jgi:hypothetical protein